MVQFMKALKPKGKKEVIYLFPQAGLEFQPNDHDLIQVCVTDLTELDILEICRALEASDPVMHGVLLKKLQLK